MTEDEINRKVAEIEGWKLMAVGGHEAKWWPPGTHPAQNIFSLPDSPPAYATDWQWCGPLIEKYGMHCGRDILFQGMRWSAGPPDMTWSQYANTPQRAICLAVIAAHDQPTTSGHWTGLGDK